MRPLVSVVVPAWNGARFLDATLASVLAGTWEPVELIVVDDGSTDGTPELLARYAGRARVLRQENRGVAAARNAGAAAARGELFAFLDQDDVWEPDLLATLVPALLGEPEQVLVFADAWVVDARGRAHGRRSTELRCAGGARFEGLIARNSVPVETTLVRREAFTRAGGFDPRFRYLEDWDLVLRLARLGPFGYVDRPLARYRVHARNLSHDLEPLLRERALLLAGLADRCGPLAPREERSVARERRSVALDLAWTALRRGDLAAATVERAGARGGPLAKRTRVALLAWLLRHDPLGLGHLARAVLPRRRIHGLVASDLEPGDSPDP